MTINANAIFVACAVNVVIFFSFYIDGIILSHCRLHKAFSRKIYFLGKIRFVTLDISQAFDRVCNGALISKMYSFENDPTLIQRTKHLFIRLLILS